MELGEWVRGARTKAALSQEDFGDRLGVTKGNVSHWETGKHNPSFHQMLMISAISGYPMPNGIEILTGEDVAAAVTAIGMALNAMSDVRRGAGTAILQALIKDPSKHQEAAAEFARLTQPATPKPATNLGKTGTE